jgi:hypothetical protein
MKMFLRLTASLVSAVFLLPSVLAVPAFSVQKDGQVAKPWPDKTLKIAYDTEATKILVDDIVQKGFALWSDAGLKLETQVGYKDTDKVLKLTTNNEGKMATTVGYRPGDQMTMSFDPNPSKKVGNGNIVVAMAHELGTFPQISPSS